MADNQQLSIIDESGKIVGQDTRDNIHAKGLLHQETHVWLYTPQGEIIFQHRAKDKDTYPDLLDATAGGHVEIGDDYEKTALKELQEETGIQAVKEALTFIEKVHSKTFDIVTARTNNVIRAIFAYRYEGKVEDLRIEKDKAIGFESWPIEKILHLSEDEKKRFIPSISSTEHLNILKKIIALI